MLRRVAPLAVATVLAVALSACAASGAATRAGKRPASEVPPAWSAPSGPSESAPASPEVSAGHRTSDGRPTRGLLSIPKLGIRGLAVVPYRGRTDDARGTVIQNRGVAASPHCATLEDHAEGNYWADEFDNPEHRIDKIGVLVRSRAA